MSKEQSQPSGVEIANFFEAIVASSDDAIISKDLQGNITSWNTAAERIFGYKADEVIGQSIAILIPIERINEEPGILARIRRGERVDHYETVRRRKDGSLLDISLTVSPIKNSDGKIVGASKIARNITEQKRAAAALREAQTRLEMYARDLESAVQERTAALCEKVADLEAFSYTVSHDLRAPLRAMQGFAFATLEDYGKLLDGQAQDYLKRIVAAGERLDRLIRDVLAYSQLVRAHVQLDVVNLEQLVDEVIDLYPPLKEPQAQIQIQRPLLRVLGHEAFLTQSISNLLSNAVKFVSGRQTPRVRVWTEPVGDQVRIWIEDEGIGIAPEHQRRIFGMFERLHGDNHYEGTGIGLAVVRKAVQRMGGTCGLESELGRGSRFWIMLAAPAEVLQSGTRAG